MNSSKYLKSYGWKEGEALKKGGIKKPILVKHKKDKKGIGHDVNGSADAWWERLFDGQLKGLEVQDEGKGLSFKQDKEVVATAVRKSESPLYRMFVRGETLQGTTGKVIITKTTEVKSDGVISDITEIKTSFNENIPSDSSSTTQKKDKKTKSSTKDKKERKEKKDKVEEMKEKKKKTEKKDKKDKKDKKEKKTGESKKRKKDDDSSERSKKKRKH